MTGQGRGLFISAYFPSEDIPAAGNRVAAAALAALAARHEAVDIVTFQNPGEAAWRPRLIERPGIAAHVHGITLAGRLLASIVHPTLPAGASVRRFTARATMRRLLRMHTYNEIRIEFTQAADVLPRRYRAQATLRVHDVMTELYGRQQRSGGIRRWIGALESQRVQRWEPPILRQFSRVLTLSERDANTVRNTGRTGPTDVEPPRDFYVVTGRSSATILPGTLLFWANYGRPENEEAARFLIEHILPRIRAEVPGVRLILAGANPPAWADRPADGVSWTGFVKTPDDLFRTSAVGVAPLIQGAGVKIKVLEFLASGIPTVATPVGAEGIEPSPLLHVADGAEKFAKACIELLVAGRSGG